MERLIALAWKTFWVALGASLVVVLQSVMMLEGAGRAAAEPPVPPPASTGYVPFSPANPALNGTPVDARTAPPRGKTLSVPAISRLSSRSPQGPLG